VPSGKGTRHTHGAHRAHRHHRPHPHRHPPQPGVRRRQSRRRRHIHPRREDDAPQRRLVAQRYSMPHVPPHPRPHQHRDQQGRPPPQDAGHLAPVSLELSPRERTDRRRSHRDPVRRGQFGGRGWSEDEPADDGGERDDVEGDANSPQRDGDRGRRAQVGQGEDEGLEAHAAEEPGPVRPQRRSRPHPHRRPCHHRPDGRADPEQPPGEGRHRPLAQHPARGDEREVAEQACGVGEFGPDQIPVPDDLDDRPRQEDHVQRGGEAEEVQAPDTGGRQRTGDDAGRHHRRETGGRQGDLRKAPHRRSASCGTRDPRDR